MFIIEIEIEITLFEVERYEIQILFHNFVYVP